MFNVCVFRVGLICIPKHSKSWWIVSLLLIEISNRDSWVLIKSSASLLKFSAFSRSVNSPDLSASSTLLEIEYIEVVDVDVVEVVVVAVVISFLFLLCSVLFEGLIPPRCIQCGTIRTARTAWAKIKTRTRLPRGFILTEGQYAFATTFIRGFIPKGYPDFVGKQRYQYALITQNVISVYYQIPNNKICIGT